MIPPCDPACPPASRLSGGLAEPQRRVPPICRIVSAAQRVIYCGQKLHFVHNRGSVASSLLHILSEFFGRYGYWAVFFGVMAENIGVPVPGETVLLFAGFLAYQGRLHILPTVVTSIAGATAGAVFGYWIGWHGGTPLANRLLRRFPRFARKYEGGQKTLLKYGRWAVFAARFITGLRVFVALIAGVVRMPFSTFLFFTFAGAVCWSVVIGYLGFLFGSSWARLVGVMGRIDRIVLLTLAGGAVVAIVVYVVRRRKTC